MQLHEIITSERIVVDSDGSSIDSKPTALKTLADLLGPVVGVEPSEVEGILAARERLQSTGIGEGVAIPHGSLEKIPRQAAALLLCPNGVEFEAIDGRPAQIILGLVGPKMATAEHLRLLARVSRLLRNPQARQSLLNSTTSAQAYACVTAGDDSKP